MRVSLRKLFGISLVFLLSATIFSAGTAHAYLFEANQAKFKEIKKVSSRSFKFLATFDASKDAETIITSLRNAVIAAAKAEGYEYKERKKGDEWRYSEKRFFDTAAYDLYKKGYVIRETYRFNKGEGPSEKFVLTVKEMSPSDFVRLANSKLGPVEGSESLVKFEENISLTNDGKLQSYFESAIGSKVKNKNLGARTLADYGKLYPELVNLGIPASTKLISVTGYSTQLKFGSFKLPGGDEAKMDIEVWSRSSGGKVFVAEVSFDTKNDEGYATSVTDLKASEDFFTKVFGKAFTTNAMPGSGPYMGSKVRTLFDQKK